MARMTKSKESVEELQMVLELTKLLNSSNDINYILNAVMDRTLKLLKRADIGVIFLYDKIDDVLKLEYSVGFGNIKMSLKPGESITGIAFNQKKTLHLKSHQEMVDAMASMGRNKFSILEDKISKPMANLQSSISCPLMHNEECVGVFVIDNYYGKDPLNEQDIYLAELISLHATIAIVNASNYKIITDNQLSLERYSNLVEEEKNRYEYSTYLHNKFTEMVLNGNSINDIVKEVSVMLRKDVFTVDMTYKMSSYAGEYFIDEEKLKQQKINLISLLSKKRQSIFYSKEISNWIYFNPISVNKEVLGWVGVVSDTGKFSELERIAIDKCSTIIALERLKMNELADMQQSLKGDFLENLLSDRSTEFMTKFAEKYHYNFDGIHQLIIMRMEYKNVDAVLRSNLRYIFRDIQQLNMNFFSNSITLQKRNYIITIFDREDSFDKVALSQLIETMLEKANYVLSQIGVEFECTIGVSEIIRTNSDFREIYDNTMQIFRLDLDKRGNCNYYYFEDLEIKRFLLNNKKEDLEKFVNKTFGPLREYANASRVDLYDTLKIYVQTGGNWTLTKEMLHIHGNTLSYRLKRLKEILEYDFTIYQNRFRLQIALEIIELYPELSVL
jgi:sugar diacid utilization regulator